MKNHKLLFLFISLVLIGCGKSKTVSSPDGSLCVRFEQNLRGNIGYSVYRDGECIIHSSPLGFQTDKQYLGDGFYFKGRKKGCDVKQTEDENKEFKETDERHQAEDQLGETRTILHRCEGH